MIEMKVLGLKELDEALKRFPEQIQRQELSKALRKAAVPMLDDIRSRAPIRDAEEGTYLKHRKGWKVATIPGNLAANIRLRMRTIAGLPTALIGWSRRGAYGMWDEFGTSHQPARPFMRPGFDSSVPQFLRDFAFELRLGIERVARKLYNKAA